MKISPRLLLAPIAALALVLSACGADSTGAEPTVAATAEASVTPTESVEMVSLFDDGALTSSATTVDCTLENGTSTTCYQFEVASLASTVDTEGPYCPETTADVGGIWVWDGDEPGLYALDAEYWALMDAQGYDFVNDAGEISISDPASPSQTDTDNSCLEATPDGSYHLQVLIPTEPEMLDTPVDLSTISQIGLAFDGVTIFGDAPSVADRGGLPALDACGGHIDPSGYYHWHFGSESIQTNLDSADTGLTCGVAQNVEAPFGLSFDGHVIYGPEENGEVPTDLDECGGHVSDTAEFGEVYHYHLSYDSPNLPLCRVGAAAEGKISSPDNSSVALPDGESGGGGDGGGPPEGR